MEKEVVEKIDAVEFGNSFEDYLEKECPHLGLSERADMGRRVIEFIESLQA